jgi:hypothetical protein
MSVQADRGRWVVRWRDESGRQRGRSFESQDAAHEFDARDRSGSSHPSVQTWSHHGNPRLASARQAAT